MSSIIADILCEWENACYYSDQILAEAYTTFLSHLLECSDEERQDPRIPAFLKGGYEAYLREQNGADRQADLTYRMAMQMVGGSFEPQPGEKRPREPELDPELEPESQPTIEILQSRERELKRFKTKFREEIAQIKNLGTELPDEEMMASMFDAMLTRQREAVNAKDDDRVILEIENAASADNPLWFSMRRTDQMSGQVILDKLSRVLNSNQNFMANGQLTMSYIHIPTPHAGSGRRNNRVPNESIDDWVARKITSKSIFSPANTQDAMCLARSVAVAKAKEGMSRHAFYRMKQTNSVIQKNEANKLCELANIDPNQPCGLGEVRQLQNVLPDYRLCVFTDKKR
jgi:hypothetical protein